MSPIHLTGRDWLIQPEALRAMAATARAFHGGPIPDARPANPLLTVEDGIGVLAIEGPILRKPDPFARVLFGATDSEEIGAALREAGDRPDIKAVFLDIDSPGGTVAGTPELAAAVSALNDKKPVYAFTSGLMCSAAYWIGSQARAVYTTPSAQVGSIGVMQLVVDDTAALDAKGIKVEVFAVGKYKAIGAPGTTLTADQRELISSNLAETARDFHAAVLARGRSIPPEAMEGQSFTGRQAQRLNLAGVVPDRAEALRRLRVYHAVVDTGTRAMSTPLEDQLAEALARVESLQGENKAQAELLAESSANLDSLRGQVDLLSADVDTLKAERDSARGDVTGLQKQIADLQAAKADFDQRVQTEVARVVASTGTTLPARVTPAGDQEQAADLHARFAAITEPAEQTAFWRRLTPEQQALILKHQS